MQQTERFSRIGILRVLLLALAAVPPAVLIVLVDRFAVNAQFRDSLPYTFLTMQKVFFEGSITVQDFFRPNNEHILAVPMLLSLFSAWLTGWNIRVELFFVCFAAILQLFLLVRIAFASDAENRFLSREWSVLVASVLLTSPTQWGSWTLTLSIAYQLPFLFLLTAIYLLMRRGLKTMAVAVTVFLCVCASFSVANGMLTWLAILPMVWLGTGTMRSKKCITAIFLLLFVATVFVYQQSFFIIVARRASYLLVFHDPAAVLRIFLTLLGAPIAPSFAYQTCVMLLGSFVFICSMYCVIAFLRQHAHRRFAPPWICLLIFALLSCLLVAIGRAEYGISAAFVSRYFATSQFVTVATLFLLAQIVRKHVWIIPVLSLAIIAGHFLFVPTAIRDWEQLSNRQRHVGACLRVYDIASDACLRWIYPWDIPMPDLAKHAGPVLEKMGFLKRFTISSSAIFIEQPQVEYGRVESIGGLPAFPELTGTGVVVRGWAALEGCEHPPIVLTSGSTRRMIGYTVSAILRTDIPIDLRRGCRDVGWEMEIAVLPEDSLWDVWVFDEETHIFYLLPKPKD